MKVYKVTGSGSQISVAVNGQPLQSKRSLVAQESETLAFLILADCLNEDEARMLEAEFVETIVSKRDAEWEITSENIVAFRDDWFRCEAVTESPSPGKTIEAPSMTRIQRDPNYRLRGPR